MRSGISLLFIGEGAAREELTLRAGTLTPGALEFGGFAQRDDIYMFYALAEALVFPTHSDTWCSLVNESMVSGTPATTSRVPGCLADLLGDSKTGLPVPTRDYSSLARSMAFMILNPALCTQISHRVGDLIANYSPAACAAGIASATNAVAIP
jgi:glycosyltransferase involved in cell wall biosynthesis